MKQESLKFSGRASNPATRKFSPAQIAAQKLFSERARAGTLKQRKKRKPNPGLYENINAKRARIAAGSGERMRKPGSKGAPTQAAFKRSAMTAKQNPVIPSSDYDYIMIDDIKMVAVNDGNLYRQQGRPIVENLARKIAKGTFDAQKAVKLFGYLADSAVRNYSVQQLDYKKPKLTILSKPEREILAQEFLEYYADEIKDASSGYKRNPDKAKPRAYVRRASQATGAPPSKRLVARRKKALTAPAGYFPNPKTPAMMTGYQVICMHPKKHVVGVFKTMAEAKQIATALVNAMAVAYAIKTVKVQKAHCKGWDTNGRSHSSKRSAAQRQRRGVSRFVLAWAA